MSRLIIGDIHGCYYELQQLIDKAKLGHDDEIIAIGDLFDRGPEPLAVYQFFRDTPNARAIMGNHEWGHLRAQSGELPPRFSTLLTRWELGDLYAEFLAFIASLPLYLDLPEALLVHGFFEPHVALAHQQQMVLLGVTSAETYLHDTYEALWYTYYDAQKPIIIGHRDYSYQQQPFVYQDRVYAIDSRCVYGGSLTGVLLPEFELISVPSRRDHWDKIRRKHGAQ
jgi:serine/threonine protein phosphatase 1